MVAPPEEVEAGGRPRLVGEILVWLGEWDAPPEAGWEQFAVETYASGQFALFPWGVLGYQPPGDGTPERLDLHAALAAKPARDRFFLESLIIALMEYVKATQFLRSRFQLALSTRLNALQRQLVDAAAPSRSPGQPLSLNATERSVTTLATLAYDFSRGLAELEEDTLGVEIARQAIRETLETGGATARGPLERLPLLRPVDLQLRQMRSDLAYYRATEALGERAAAAFQTVVGIQQARVGTRLTIAGVLIGTFLGLGQILDTLEPEWRLLVSVGGALASVAGYWLWSKRRTG